MAPQAYNPFSLKKNPPGVISALTSHRPAVLGFLKQNLMGIGGLRTHNRIVSAFLPSGTFQKPQPSAPVSPKLGPLFG
jgi:hypothetical protein